MTHYVYILASERNGTLYIGSTNDLVRRVYEHKHKLIDGFTKQYNVNQLVWFDVADSEHNALVKERQMKEWKRQWKMNLIEKTNPEWNDLYDTII